MPDYFTHSAAAQIIYENLPEEYQNKIKSHTLYRLGAQGGDLFFAYKLKANDDNLGKAIHIKNTAELFKALLGGNRDYVAGFATHYALDCTIHPAVYAFESTKRSPFAHSNFENDLGLYVSRRFKIPRRIISKQRLLGCTFAVYDTVKRVEPNITVTGVERCIKRHFTYTDYLFRTKKPDYKYGYDYSSLDRLLDEGINLGVAAVKCVYDGELRDDVFDKSFLQKYEK